LSEASFFSNYYMLFGKDPDGWPPGSGVLWSLAVEEHFYVVFPLLLMCIMPIFQTKGRTIILVTLCICVLAWRWFLVLGCDVSDDRIYYAKDTRIDSLLFGCILGVVCNPVIDRGLALSALSKALLYLFALALLSISVVWRDEAFRATVRYSLQGLALLPIF